MHKSTPSPFRLLAVGAHAAARGQDFARHRHPCWEIVYYREGAIEMVVGDRSYATAPGAVLITPPGIPHMERALTDYANIFVILEAPADAGWPVRCYDDEGRTIGRVLALLHDECRSRLAGREAIVALLLEQLDILIRRAPVQREVSTAEAVVGRVEAQFARRMQEGVAVAAVAREAGVSESALRGYFRRVRGCSPRERLHAMRLQNARELLLHSNLKLDAIAAMCGYYSASHLTRHFRRAFGKPPGACRGHSSMPPGKRLRNSCSGDVRA